MRPCPGSVEFRFGLGLRLRLGNVADKSIGRGFRVRFGLRIRDAKSIENQQLFQGKYDTLRTHTHAHTHTYTHTDTHAHTHTHTHTHTQTHT